MSARVLMLGTDTTAQTVARIFSLSAYFEILKLRKGGNALNFGIPTVDRIGIGTLIGAIER